MLGIKNESHNESHDDGDNPLNGFVFMLATAIFLILGFAKGLWHPGWIVFIIATAITTLLDYLSKNKKAEKM